MGYAADAEVQDIRAKVKDGEALVDDGLLSRWPIATKSLSGCYTKLMETITIHDPDYDLETIILKDPTYDPDYGLKLKPEVEQELIKSLKEIKEGKKGIPIEEVIRQLGL